MASRLHSHRSSAASEVVVSLPTGQESGETPTGRATHGILRLRTEDAEVQNSLGDEDGVEGRPDRLSSRAARHAARVHWAGEGGSPAAALTRNPLHGGRASAMRLQHHDTVDVPGVAQGEDQDQDGAAGLSPSTLRAIAVALAHEEVEAQTGTGRPSPEQGMGTGAAALPAAAFAPVPVPSGSALEAIATGLDAGTLSQARAGQLLDRVIPVTPHPVPLSAARLAEMIMIHTVKAAHFDWGYSQRAVEEQQQERERRVAAAEARMAGTARGQTAGQETQEDIAARDTEALLPYPDGQGPFRPEAVPVVHGRRKRSLWQRWFGGRGNTRQEEQEAREDTAEGTGVVTQPITPTSHFGRVLDPSTVPVAAVVRPPPSPGRPFTLPLGAVTALPPPSPVQENAGEGTADGQDTQAMEDDRPPPRYFRRIRLWWRAGGRRSLSMILLTGLMIAAIAAAPVGGLFIAANIALVIAGIAAFASAARGWRGQGQEGGQTGVDGTQVPAYVPVGGGSGMPGDAQVPDQPMPPEEVESAMARLNGQQQQPVRRRRRWSIWGRARADPPG